MLWILDPHTLPLTKVQIEGKLIYTPPQYLKALIGYKAKGGFFNIDLQAIRLALLNLPWIKEVTIYRRWPNTILIALRERQFVAYWREDNLVDTEGDLLATAALPIIQPSHTEPNAQSFTQLKLPRFYAPSREYLQELLSNYNILNRLTQKAGLTIRELGCDSRQSWYLLLEQRIKLWLGHDHLDDRLQRFLKIRHRLIIPCQSPCDPRKNFITYIDLRYTHGMAVRKVLDNESQGNLKN
jgi:cell division protein FtsQ